MTEKQTTENFYEILNCTQNSTIEEIKQNYQQLILKYHPDKQNLENDNDNGGDGGGGGDGGRLESSNNSNCNKNINKHQRCNNINEIFIKINEAWNTLRDPVKRKLYDAELWQKRTLTQCNVYAELTLKDFTKTLDYIDYDDGDEEKEKKKDEEKEKKENRREEGIAVKKKGSESDKDKDNQSNVGKRYLLTYPCRCGGYYVLDENFIQETNDFNSDLTLECDECSLIVVVKNIRVLTIMSNKSKKIKKTRKCISLETKIKILDCLAGGEGPSYVGKVFNLHESTIRTIKKNETAIRKSISSGTSPNQKFTSYSRGDIIEKTEKILVMWIKDNSDKDTPLDGCTLRRKAMEIYNEIKEQQPSTSSENLKHSFCASKGWLSKFLKRQGFRGIREIGSEVTETAKACKNELSEITEADQSNQVFNVEELMEIAFHIPDCREKNDNKKDNLFSASLIREGLQLAEKLEHHFVKNDTNVQRSAQFQRDLRNCMAIYQELLNEKVKEGEMTTSLTKDNNLGNISSFKSKFSPVKYK